MCNTNFYTSFYQTLKKGKDAVVVIIHIKILEANIIVRIWIEVGAHVAFHLMKQVQIIHELVKYIASTTLPKQEIKIN